jgi:hypothetical protein
MDSKSEFHTWLQQQQDDGAFASEGSFSLKQERSWEKLGAFQLPFAEAWVLKLIQGAAALGAEEVRVSQTWRESEFSFVGGREITPSDIEVSVFEMPEYLPPGLKMLGTTVRALGKGSKHPFCLCYPGGIGQVWTGKRFVNRKMSFRNKEQFSVIVSHFEIGASISDMWSLSGDALRNKMLAISRTLVGQCYTCPAKLYLDGRQLNGPHSDPVFGLTSLVRPVAVIVNQSEALPPFSLFIERNLEKCGTSDLQIESRFGDKLSVGEFEEQSLMLMFSAFLEDERQMGKLRRKAQVAEFLWVVDGVVTQRERLEWKGPVSFAVLVSGAGLETDLTGLALRGTDSYFARRNLALSEAVREISSREGWQHGGLLRFYSEHPLAKFLAWLEKRLQGSFGRRIPLRTGRLAPSALERQSRELDKAFRAAVNHLCNDLQHPLPRS